MNALDKVAVCSRSFSKNDLLRKELLSRYEHVSFNETGRQFFGDELIEFLRGHNKAIVGLETVDRNLLAQLPELDVIAKYGVGLDKIDMKAMRSHGKRLGWTAGVNRRSVAELVIAFSIVLLRGVLVAHRLVLDGVWQQVSGGLLSGRVFGIIGCGNVGQDLVRLLQPFGCKVLVHDIRDYPEFFREFSVESVSLEDLLRRSDIVSLHIPFDQSTSNILSVEKLQLMKNGAFLINTARGGLVDEKALRSALVDNKIAAAAFDVFAQEPPTDTELLKLPNFLVTPHIGGSSLEAIHAMGMAAIEGLDDNNIPKADL